MDERFLKKISVMTAIFMLLFVNLSGICIASTNNNANFFSSNAGNGIKRVGNYGENDNLNSPIPFNELAKSQWPMFNHDLNHTARSEYNTSNNGGHELWNFTTKGFNGVASSPAIGPDGTIYFGTSDNKLQALTQKGKNKWNYTTGNVIYGSSPAIGLDGTVYVGSFDFKLYAIKKDGSFNWRFSTNSFITSSPAIGPDGTIYIGSEDNSLYAIHQDGTKKWSYPTIGYIRSSPAVDKNGTIYFGSSDHNLYALHPDGTYKWAFATGSVILFSSPAIDTNGMIYIGSWDHKLYSIYPNGTKRWSFTTGDKIESSPAIGSDGTIYFGSFDTKFYAVNPNGTKKWDFKTGGTIQTSPAIGLDGIIYFSSGDNKTYAIYPNGTEKWEFNAGSYPTSNPAIDLNGTIYFGTYDNKLHAINSVAPNTPQMLPASGGNALVDLAWTAPKDDGGSVITNFTICRGIASGLETFLAKIGNVHTYQDKGVINGQTYYYRVSATNSIGEGPTSNEINVTPAATPTAPQNLKAVQGNATITLTWTTPADDGGASITNYKIYRNGTPSTTLGIVQKYIDVGLTNGATYIYNVSAINRIGEGPKSIGINAVPRTIPSAPRDLSAISGKYQVSLKWKAPANDGGFPIINYSIYRGTSAGDETLFSKGYAGGTSFINTNLTIGTAYYYIVSAVNAIGEGAKSSEQYAIPYGLPNAPTLTATAGNSNVRLSWSVPDSNGAMILNYTIYRGTVSDDDVMFIKGFAGGTSWVDNNITIGTTYYYKVSAINIAGEGPESNEENATPYGLPYAPILTATAGISKVILSWTEPSSNGATLINYNIYQGTKSNNEAFIGESSTGARSWADTNITVGVTYYYIVTSVNIAGEGPKSNEQNATPYSVPGAPKLTINAGALNFTLLWTKPVTNGASIANYNVYRGTASGNEAIFVSGYNGGTSWIDTNVSYGIQYYYKVSAVNTAGEGTKSNEVGVSLSGVDLPQVPIGFSATPGNAQVALKWSAPTNGEKINHYNIYRSDAQTGTYILIASPSETQYKDSGLTNGHSYWYKIDSQNSYGVSENTTAISAAPHSTSNALNSFSLGLIGVIIVVAIIIGVIAIMSKRKRAKS